MKKLFIETKEFENKTNELFGKVILKMNLK